LDGFIKDLKNLFYTKFNKGGKLKIAISFLISFFLLSFNSFGQQDTISAPQSHDTIFNNSYNISKDSQTISSLNYRLIPQNHFDSFLTIISLHGIVLDKSKIVAMGEYSSSDSMYIFAIFLEPSGRPVRQDFAFKITKNIGDKKLTIRMPDTTKSIKPKLRQDGRVYFMINCAVKSIGVYSSGLSLAFPTANEQVLFGSSLLALGISLYGSYAYTQKMELGYGRVEMMNYGGDLGIIYPNLISFLLANSTDFKYYDELRGWGQMILFPLGIFAGSKVNFAGNFEYGDASIMTTSSKFGLLYGFMLPLFFKDFSSKEYIGFSTGFSMLFIPTGFYIGKLLVGDKHYSSGRSALITTAAVMGALSGALFPTLWEENQKEVYAATTLIGHLLGTTFGFNYMHERSYTFGQGMFMAASAVVGTAVAEAFPLIAQADGNKYHRVYTTCGIIGSWGGLMLGEILSRALFEKSGRDNPKTASISLPALYQLPILIAYSQSKSNANLNINVPLLELRF
jgi:hypothetical protein